MRFFIITLALLSLSACGFSPLYGKGAQTSAVQDHLALVDIASIPNREGQFLRNELIDRFYRSGRPTNPDYVLEIDELVESLIDLDITKASDTTRGQLKITATMVLKDANTNKTLLKRSLRAITSYNVLGSEFATRVSEDSTRLNAITDLARQIEQQIALYLRRSRGSPA